MKKALKLLTTALFATFLTFSYFNVVNVSADTYGEETTATVGDYKYWFSSTTQRSSVDGVSGMGQVYSNTNLIPSGYMGVNAKLYNSNGTLVESSGMSYNSTVAGRKGNSTKKVTTNGTYYTKSQIALFHGDGYLTFWTKQTPNIERSLVKETYGINENGLSFGSDYYAESLENSPDLIRVIGINGVEGYVYSNDINLELNTLDEVLNYINSGQPSYVVPVYAEDGTTVVDSFELSNEYK